MPKSLDVVARLVKASLEGWRDYLKNPGPGNALIKADNPKMTDGQIEFALQKMKEMKAIDRGDAATLGVGIITADRYKQIYDFMVAGGLLGLPRSIGTRFSMIASSRT